MAKTDSLQDRGRNADPRRLGRASTCLSQRADFETIASRHFGMQRGTEWADLHPKDRRNFTTYGIGEAEWKALHAAEWSEIGGNRYLMPVDARNIPDGAIRDLLAKGSTSQRAMPVTDETIRKRREDLADTIHAMLYDQGSYAIFAPSARTRAILFQGTQQTSPNLYKAMQLFWQFRVWPAEMIMRTWGRLLYGGDGNMEKVANVTELVVASAVFGALAEMLRETVQGQDPRQRIHDNPGGYVLRGLMRSGAGTIAGDYLFGEYDRHGRSFLGQLAGPTYGQADNLMQLKTDFMEGLTKGKWAPFAAGGLHEIRQNLPFVDMWWTFKAFDYLVTYRLLEWINPGYLQRMEQRMKKQQGIDFMVSPQKVAG
jgi:hypothetical protein